MADVSVRPGSADGRIAPDLPDRNVATIPRVPIHQVGFAGSLATVGLDLLHPGFAAGPDQDWATFLDRGALRPQPTDVPSLLVGGDRRDGRSPLVNRSAAIRVQSGPGPQFDASADTERCCVAPVDLTGAAATRGARLHGLAPVPA